MMVALSQHPSPPPCPAALSQHQALTEGDAGTGRCKQSCPSIKPAALPQHHQARPVRDQNFQRPAAETGRGRDSARRASPVPQPSPVRASPVPARALWPWLWRLRMPSSLGGGGGQEEVRATVLQDAAACERRDERGKGKGVSGDP